jgi:hypothetical protein
MALSRADFPYWQAGDSGGERVTIAAARRRKIQPGEGPAAPEVRAAPPLDVPRPQVR